MRIGPINHDTGRNQFYITDVKTEWTGVLAIEVRSEFLLFFREKTPNPLYLHTLEGFYLTINPSPIDT
jgi:hypothetical protein